MTLPPDLRDFFDGTALESKVGPTALLVTSTREGVPHLAMLSVGEVLARPVDALHLALHRHSGTARALAQNPHALLSMVLEGIAFQVGLRAHEVEVEDPSSTATAYFRAEVERCKEEQAPYARLVSGVTYELTDPASTLVRWHAKLGVLARL